jgi:hypothetical protein
VNVAAGVLRVDNESHEDLDVVIGSRFSKINAGMTKEYVLPDKVEFGVFDPRGKSLLKATAEPTVKKLQPTLEGSSIQPTTFPEVLVDMRSPESEALAGKVQLAMAVEDRAGWRELQLGDVVTYAHMLSCLTVAKWNAQPELDREEWIAGALRLIRSLATPKDIPMDELPPEVREAIEIGASDLHLQEDTHRSRSEKATRPPSPKRPK